MLWEQHFNNSSKESLSKVYKIFWYNNYCFSAKNKKHNKAYYTENPWIIFENWSCLSNSVGKTVGSFQLICKHNEILQKLSERLNMFRWRFENGCRRVTFYPGTLLNYLLRRSRLWTSFRGRTEGSFNASEGEFST